MYFEPKKKCNTGMYNLREASIALGKDCDFISKKRNEGEWPKGVKLTRKRMALFMQEADLEVLRQFYGVSNDE